MLWVTLVAVALSSAAIKAAGPVLVGGHDLPPRVTAVIALMAPALLTALVIVETFSDERRFVLDAKAVGVGVAGLALLLRAPMLAVVALAAAATAAARALG